MTQFNFPSTLTCNRHLIEKIGLHNAILLEYFYKQSSDLNHLKDADGFFSSLINFATASTGLSQYEINQSLSFLVDRKLITCKVDASIINPVVKYRVEEDAFLAIFGLKKIQSEQKYWNILRKFSLKQLNAIHKYVTKAFKELKKTLENKRSISFKEKILNRKHSIPTRFHIKLNSVQNINTKYDKDVKYTYDINRNFFIQSSKCIHIHKKTIKYDHKIHSKRKAHTTDKHYKKGLERAVGVFTTQDEHNILVTKYGEKWVLKGYEYLSKYLLKNPKKKLKAYFALENWAIRRGTDDFAR